MTADSGDADTLPDNENQLLGTLAPDRGLSAGDYVLSTSGLLGALGTATHDYYIEVPPSLALLVVEIFDADLGAGDIAGTEEHDQDNGDNLWNSSATYALFDPSGVNVASIQLGPRDCDPVTVGLQSSCNNSWSDLGTLSVANPTPGHWRLAVGSSNTGSLDEDDNNAFGIRAHDGDATSGSTEINVYADTYVGIGQVFAQRAASDPGYSRTHDFFPHIAGYCSVIVNDFDTDFDGDESLTWTTRSGGAPTFTPTFSDDSEWHQNPVSGFTSDTAATDYGLWNQRWVTGSYNFLTAFVGDPSADNPTNGSTTPIAGGPDMQPEPGAVRLYLPADGSRFFGERGGADDVVIAPDRPWVGHSWDLLAGEPPLTVGVTSRVRVTITASNPGAQPIQFSATPVGADVVMATVPTNGGQTTFVTGSATASGGSSTATAASGTGPWNLTFAPGVVNAGASATLTYDIDVLPTVVGPINFTGEPATMPAGPGDGTLATFIDGTCAEAGGGPSPCIASALPRATTTFGPLCGLFSDIVDVGVAALTVTKTAGMVVPSTGNPGQFEVPFQILVENTGTTDLAMVQVVDDLTATFPPPATAVVIAGPAASGTLSVNGGYDGSGDTDLLVAGSSTLPLGASEILSLMVRFDPNGLPGPFSNLAEGAAQDLLTNPATDSDSALVTIVETPSIDLAKTAGAVTDLGGGQFETTFTLVATNTGDVDLTLLQVTDDLTTAFPAPSSVASAMVSCTAGSCGGVTLDYTGPPDTSLLDASASSLSPSASITLELTVTFEPNDQLGPFTNSATTSGQSPQGSSVQDVDSAAVSISENPGIAVTKVVDGPVVDNMDGSYSVPYLITVTNTGDVGLRLVQVTDDLAATYPAPTVVTTVTVPVVSGTLTGNPDFNGSGDTELLVASTSTLAVAGSETIAFTVTFDANGVAGPFTNTADSAGVSPAGATVVDSGSVDVSVTLGLPVIGVAKSSGEVIANSDGTFTVSISIVVANLGPLDLVSVQVVDDLGITFPPPASVVSVMPPTATITVGSGLLTPNAAFDGVVDTDLLVASTSTLNIDARGEIVFDITFDPGTITEFFNQAMASGDSSNGTTTDLSDSGTEPDADNNGDPGNSGEDDPTLIVVILPPMPIPTLNEWGLIGLVVLLALLGSRRLGGRWSIL